MSPSFPTLLAKSNVGDSLPLSVTMLGHTNNVFLSSRALLGFGSNMLLAVGLDPAEWQQRLCRTVALAAAIHDLGKANSVFQQMIQGSGSGRKKQSVRHEWVSVWIATQPDVKQWLLPALNGCEMCWHVAMYAVCGHHPKTDRVSPTFKCFQEESREIEVYVDHQDFTCCLNQIRDWFDLDQAHPKIEPTLHGGAGDRESMKAFVRVISALGNYWDDNMRGKPDWKRFCAVVKATLIGGDVAGSALWEHIDSASERESWIKGCLARVPSARDLAEVVAARLDGKEPYEFQKEIAASKASITLVEAGCGGGKTAAAYMWARDQHVGRRLWFCYPTTGTATEGYRGYLHDTLPQGSESRASLFHSRADFDIKQMLDTDDLDEDSTDNEICIESLKAWDTQIVACTVDTVLFLLQNQRKGIYAWPALANAAIVFDEIHCYDETLFGNLLTWLENTVGIPVLLMTASLPAGRRDAIKQTVENAHRTFHHIRNGNPRYEGLPRYQNESEPPLTNVDVAINQAVAEYAAGGRVLWISNTVTRCRQTCEKLANVRPVIYHSRFIYEDRLKQHGKVVEMFEHDDPAFASTSQVAELSLDLGNVTLLVTELCPIPAMIQRLGRLNRRADPDADPPVIRPFIVIEPLDENGKLSILPYDEEELDLAREWLKRLGATLVSQSDLIRAWVALDKSLAPDAEPSCWLIGGPKTQVASVRDPGHGVSVIWEQHEAAARKEGATPYVLPMNRPVRSGWKSGSPVRGYPIASKLALDYDDQTGGRWKNGGTK